MLKFGREPGKSLPSTAGTEQRLVQDDPTRLEHIMLFFLPIILFRNSSYFNLLFSYYHPIILMNLFKKMSQCIKIMM